MTRSEICCVWSTGHHGCILSHFVSFFFFFFFLNSSLFCFCIILTLAFFLLLSTCVDQNDEIGNLLCMITQDTQDPTPSRVHFQQYFFTPLTLFSFLHYVTMFFFFVPTFVTLGEPKWQVQKSAVYDQLATEGTLSAIFYVIVGFSFLLQGG